MGRHRVPVNPDCGPEMARCQAVTVMEDGTVPSATRGHVAETTEGTIDDQAFSLTCTTMLERIGGLT